MTRRTSELRLVARWRTWRDSPYRWSSWAEILFRRDKVEYWRAIGPAWRAGVHVRRLRALLAMQDRDQESLTGQECRALIAEVEGRLAQALKHRRRQLALCRKLLAGDLPGGLEREIRAERAGCRSAIRRLEARLVRARGRASRKA